MLYVFAEPSTLGCLVPMAVFIVMLYLSSAFLSCATKTPMGAAPMGPETPARIARPGSCPEQL